MFAASGLLRYARNDELGDGMRIAAIALVISAAIGTADARAANPYEVFRLGMSEAEALAAAKEHDGDLFDLDKREWRKPKDLGAFRVLYGHIPMEPQRAIGMFVFEHDRLKKVRFDYFLMNDYTPAEICDEIFEQAKSDISEIYGPHSDSSEPARPEPPFQVKAEVWKSKGSVVSLFMSDAPHPMPRRSCSVISSDLFDGNEVEHKAFEARLSEAIRKAEQ